MTQLCGFLNKLWFAAADPRSCCALFGNIILHKVHSVSDQHSDSACASIAITNIVSETVASTFIKQVAEKK